MAYDASRSACVLAGTGGTWTLAGAAWANMTAFSPSGPLVYDTLRNRVMSYDGSSTWALGTGWTQLAVANAPSDRSTFAMAFDSHRNVAVLFGGVANGSALGDTWEFQSTAANVALFGVGCGTPALSVGPRQGSRPALGRTYSSEVTGVPYFFAAMAIGFSNTSALGSPLPLDLSAHGMPGCHLYHDVAADLAQICQYVSPGIGRHDLPIPANPVLLGTHVYLQTWASSLGTNAAGIVTSNGVDLIVGEQ